MENLNFVAIGAAAVAAFVASAIWYVIFGKQMAEASQAFAEIQKEKPAAWRMLAVFSGSVVLSFVLAYMVGLKPNAGWAEAVGMGVLLWLGLSAVQWMGAMVWEKVPFTMAAIHAGDWLMKIVLITTIVGLWR